MITLVPIGPVESDLLGRLAEGLHDVLHQRIIVEREIPIPDTSYNARREQYRGDAFLAALEGVRTGADCVLGITDVDCYTSGLNFIFGQAVLGGGKAFVAVPRLRQSFYGLPEDGELFHERFLKEAVHELGHALGLGHCPDVHCVMHFSNTLGDTDRKHVELCLSCRGRIHRS